MKLNGFIKQTLKIIVGMVVGLVLIVVVLARFGTYEVRYKCSGSFVGEREEEGLLFLRIEYFRPFMFWVDRDANVWSEVPNAESGVYFNVHKAGDTLMFSSDFSNSEGGFSLLSHAVYLNGRSFRFEGMCSKLESDD